ncbi:leucyl aminopeptidase, partial [Francisella tularensis subsp. holarctica]|uniref:M17 family peptidase N-terminal domain-containing protein n=1 Tax=Francisella tularensis TaxID=263 RepID=UPI002381BE38
TCPKSKGLLDRRIFKAKSGEVLPLLHVDKIVILLGLGLRQDFIASEYDKIIDKAAEQLKKLAIKEISVDIEYACENDNV